MRSDCSSPIITGRDGLKDFDFERLVLEERAAGRMKDDDSTLVVIGVR